MNANERRQALVDKYKTILGRNYYSQDGTKRCYVYKKYSNGCYYSDCSSSICATYKECGEWGTITNTVGLYNSSAWKDVDIGISKGQITDVSKLRVGDILLFAGNDSSRKSSGYVGHVEMVAVIDGSKVTLYGHGSNKPSAKEMTAYCKTRYNTKASTALGNRGLIKVRRMIWDDAAVIDDPVKENEPDIFTDGPTITKGRWFLRVGPGKEYDTCGIAEGGQTVEVIARLVGNDDWMFVKVGDHIGFIGKKAVSGVSE